MLLLSAIRDSPEARRVEPGWLKSQYNSSMFRPRRDQLQVCPHSIKKPDTTIYQISHSGIKDVRIPH